MKEVCKMLVVGILVLGFWVVCNFIVLIKWKPAEMWVDLVEQQTVVGRIFGNLFYLPYWLVHLIIGLLRMYVFKYLKIAFFAVARFIQQIYHSIFDIL
jgi:hypothetical protein